MVVVALLMTLPSKSRSGPEKQAANKLDRAAKRAANDMQTLRLLCASSPGSVGRNNFSIVGDFLSHSDADLQRLSLNAPSVLNDVEDSRLGSKPFLFVPVLKKNRQWNSPEQQVVVVGRCGFILTHAAYATAAGTPYLITVSPFFFLTD